jgi:hypothetical protein
MKRKGRHRQQVLSDTFIATIRVPGRYADGNGLYLVVSPSGAKRWILRIVIDGRRRDLGLGGAAYVTLNEAREKARAYRNLVRERKTLSILRSGRSQSARRT